MSVRKTAAPAGSIVGVQVVKTLGFWIAMAVCSFVVGLFILSPLINVARSSHNPTSLNASAGAGQPSGPSPSRHAATAASNPQRNERRADTDVQITPDRANHSAVQTPEHVDDAASHRDDPAARTDGNTDGSRDSTNRNPYRRDNSADRTDTGRDAESPQPADSLDHPSANDRTQRDDADRSDQSGAAPPDPPARRRRSRRQPIETAPTRNTPDSAGGGVQRGESIDR